MPRKSVLTAGAVVACAITGAAPGSIIVTYNDPSGLAAIAEFTVLNLTTLQVRLRNVSTGVPLGFSNSDQLLTGLSIDFGPAGAAGITITGGTVKTGATSASLNFSVLNVGANADVGSEWGFSNVGGTGMLQNFISTNAAHITPFGGANLDGPVNLSGPQGGLVASSPLVPLGGLGAIQDEIVGTLDLSGSITEAGLMAELISNGSIVEFGSDAAFLRGSVPAPGALALLGLAGLVSCSRRRRRG